MRKTNTKANNNKVMGFRVNKKMVNMLAKICAEEGISATKFVNNAFNDYFAAKEIK